MCHMDLLDPIHGKAARARDMAQEVRDAVGPAWAPWPGFMDRGRPSLRQKSLAPSVSCESRMDKYQAPLAMLRDPGSAWHFEPAGHKVKSQDQSIRMRAVSSL